MFGSHVLDVLILVCVHVAAIPHQASINGQVLPGGQFVLEEIDSNADAYPTVLIAGIGDSGTRGVEDLLLHLGLNICEKSLHPDTLDGDYTKGARQYYAPILQASRGSISSLQQKAAVFQTAVEAEKQGAAQVAECVKEKKDPPGPWGYKNPDHVVALPVMDNAFQNKTKYLLVARDPRDICTAHNQAQVNLFKTYFQGAGHDDCYQYFATLWRRVLGAYRGSGRVKVVRIEDLVRPPDAHESRPKARRVVKDMLRFLGISKKSKAAIDHQLNLMHKYKDEYGGHHYSMGPDDRDRILLQVSQRRNNKDLFNAMSLLGYHRGKFLLTQPKSAMVLH